VASHLEWYRGFYHVIVAEKKLLIEEMCLIYLTQDHLLLLLWSLLHPLLGELIFPGWDLYL
jgi:hypothetical protein